MVGGPVVIVKQGWLRGASVKSVNGGSYISFKGIPYAEPPVGNLRFADPRPPISWTGIRDALNDGQKCIQVSITDQKIIGGEDCLYLNVATKSLSGSRPVMVWIHGGAFTWGDGGTDMYSPDYLMQTDIVVVSINYRLGILGFLKLDHEVAPGNMGLKDQVAALKWVKENIAQFGGNPNNVTIFGESAGSASVHYLLKSPLAKGLYHKAILQSGVLLNPWILTPTSVDIPYRLAAVLGKETTDPREVIEYLRSIPIDKLMEAQDNVENLKDEILFKFGFHPSVDDKSPVPFMSGSLEDVALEGIDVPVMIGYTRDEGLFFMIGISDEKFSLYDENFDRLVTQDLIEKAPSKIPEVGRLIREFYLKDKQINNDTLKEFVKCCGDIFFVMGTHKLVEIQQKKRTPTYLYRFSYASPKCVSKLIYKSSLPGAGHSDELRYLFYPAMLSQHLGIEPGSTDETVSNRMVKLWTNFAETGNPTPQIDDLITVKWDPVSRTTKNYLEIGDEISAGVNPDEEAVQLSKRIDEIVNS